MNNAPPKRRKGFTLIEVLIAIALVLALTSALFGFLFDVLATRRAVLAHVKREMAGATLIKQLESDLMTCIVGDSVHGSGIRGTASSLRVLSRSVAASLAVRGQGDGATFCDLMLSEFRFDPVNKHIEGRRSPIMATINVPEFSAAEGEVHLVRFRYFDGNQWLNQFDSMQFDRLPVAIEVSLWYRPTGIEPQVDSDALNENQIAEPELGKSESQTDRFEDSAEEEEELVPPDRVRIFVIPDAKAAALSLNQVQP